MLLSQSRLLTGGSPLGGRTAKAADVGPDGSTGETPWTGRSDRAAAFDGGGING